MMRLTAGLLTAATALLFIAGCSGGGGDDEDKPKPDSDPAVTSALGDEIMVDPELAGQQGPAATAKIALPPEQRTPEAIAAARNEAAQLVGGSIPKAPAPESGSDVARLIEQAATAAQVAAAAKTGKVDCAGNVEYSAKWATALPAALSVYPRGAVQEAAGNDRKGCSLRVVSFLTPVAAGEVIDFYHARVKAAGYGAKYQVEDKDHVLGGSKAGAAYLVYARPLGNGLTEVDVVASGG